MDSPGESSYSEQYLCAMVPFPHLFNVNILKITNLVHPGCCKQVICIQRNPSSQFYIFDDLWTIPHFVLGRKGKESLICDFSSTGVSCNVIANDVDVISSPHLPVLVVNTCKVKTADGPSILERTSTVLERIILNESVLDAILFKNGGGAVGGSNRQSKIGVKHFGFTMQDCRRMIMESVFGGALPHLFGLDDFDEEGLTALGAAVVFVFKEALPAVGRDSVFTGCGKLFHNILGNLFILLGLTW